MLAATVASALASGEFVEASIDRPVSGYGDTAVQLAGAARALTEGVSARANRLTASVDGAAQEARALGLDVQALGESVGRPRRCHAAASAGRAAASARVSAGVGEAPCRVDRTATPLAFGRGAAGQHIAALGRVGISFHPRASLDGVIHRGRTLQAAAPVCLGAGGARPCAAAVSRIVVVAPGPLGVTLREVPIAGRSGHVSVRVGGMAPLASAELRRAAGVGSQLLALNGVDCRILLEESGLENLRQILLQRPLELGAPDVPRAHYPRTDAFSLVLPGPHSHACVRRWPALMHRV
jgi:hypothetical protein